MDGSITDGFDYSILDWFNSIHNPVLTEIFKILTYIGEFGAVWLLAAVIFIINKKTRYIGITILVAALLSLIVSNGIIKNLVARSRPCWLHPEVKLLIPNPWDYSFPSGHSSNGFACASAIYAWNRKYGTAALILATLIAVTRMYFYVHFPTDILAGMILGIIFGITAYHIVRCISKHAG